MRVRAQRRRRTILAVAFAIAYAIATSAQCAGAQETARPGVIDGVVTDSALVPVGDATVSIFGSNVRILTGPNGRFRVRDMNPGAYILIVRRIGFEARRKFGEGQFMTQGEMEKRNVVGLSDLLGTFKGIPVDPNGGAVWPLRATGDHGRPCQLQVFLDGIKMPPLDINDYAPPREVAGIEVYLGPSTIPLQYKSTSGGGFCGVIPLWTRIGS